MRSLSFTLVTLLLACVVSACSASPTPTPTMASEQTEIDTQAYHPLDTQTQIKDIDVVLQAVASGDPEAVVELFGYARVACLTVVNALGGPPQCRTGETDGTTVSVLPVLSHEGTYIRDDEAEKFQGLQVIGIYAIFKNTESAYSEENFPAGDYSVLLIGSGTNANVALRIDGGKIVRLDYLFDASSFSAIVARDMLSFILEPKQ